MIGDGESYQAWTVDVKNLGGVATTWPFGWNGASSGPYTGAPAARFDAATFQALLSSGVIAATDPTGITTNQQWVYVLAPESVVDTAPSAQQMTIAQQIGNFLFSDWGEALAAFPSTLQQELAGMVGFAGNILGMVGAAAAGVVKDTVSPLLTTPVLIGGGVLALAALAFVVRKH